MILESRPVRRFTVHPVLPGDKSITLSWGAVAGASEYQIYRGEGVFACDFGKAKAGATTSTTFTDTGLQNGRDYSYVVIPMGPAASCFGPASACATEQPGAGGGGIPCADLRNMRGRCIAGPGGDRLGVNVVLTDATHDGELVTLTVDGVPQVLTIAGNAARYRARATAGDHTVSLVDPASCLADIVVTCP